MKLRLAELKPINGLQQRNLLNELIENRTIPALICSQSTQTSLGFSKEIMDEASLLQRNEQASVVFAKFCESNGGSNAKLELNGQEIDFSSIDETNRFTDLLRSFSLTAKRAGLKVVLLVQHMQLAPPAAINIINNFLPESESSVAYDAVIYNAPADANIPMANAHGCSLFLAV